jgi:hypothetical protein
MITRSRAGFTNAILDNLWVDSKNSAQLFDNIFREQTRRFADDLGGCFEVLIEKLDGQDVARVDEPLMATQNPPPVATSKSPT